MKPLLSVLEKRIGYYFVTMAQKDHMTSLEALLT